MDAATALRPLLDRLLGASGPVAVRFWDGSRYGAEPAPATIVVRSPDALRRLLTSPGELGLGRAYVAGELDLEGDLWTVLRVGEGWRPRLAPGEVVQLLAASRRLGILRPRRLPLPPEEARLRGRRHTRERDAAAIAHHYDLSNEFYALVLGPSLTYSCAYFSSPDQSLEEAQRDKHELICRKLRLQPGERLLDVGCGWGTLAIHAATHFGVRVVGVTISQRQAELAEKRVGEAGVADRVEIRLQDERDVDDGPYDAIASVGMFEHVGKVRLAEYFRHLHALLRPGGRLLNHGITCPPRPAGALWPRSPRRGFELGGDAPTRALRALWPRPPRRGFIDRYVFPDGELHEVGAVISTMQEAGFEVRDLENLREHYVLTLRRWVANLEATREEALTHVSEGRYRVWRLYMAAAALNFERGRTQVHQVLAVRSDAGRSGLPLRRSPLANVASV